MVQIKISMLLTTVGVMSAAIGCSAATITNSLLLAEVAKQLSLPASTWSASGTHTAKGFTSESAETASEEGLKLDCQNINLNKKLAVDFRSDVFGPGVTGFFYKCEKVSEDTNNYWFTISAGNEAQIDKLCDRDTTYPIVYDQQHNTCMLKIKYTSMDDRSHSDRRSSEVKAGPLGNHKYLSVVYFFSK